MTMIDGEVAAGFEAVRAAFEANFARHGDIGAAVCVYRDGRPVVDLWGGVADPDTGRPWARDTLQLVYSATKGATATAAHLLAQRGDLDLDAPVATYWPEFAANDKAEIPVRWLLSHQAGLVALDKPVPLAEALAWHPMVAALAAQRPQWTPGTAHGYHGRTFGWLVGEVIRRVSGRMPGRFFADEVADPLGLDFFIGLPAGERDRVSRMVYRQEDVDPAAHQELVPEEFRDALADLLAPDSLSRRAFEVTDPAEMDFNSPELQAAQMPSSNGIGTARALARMYAALIGEVDGVRLFTPQTLASATKEQASGADRVMVVVPSRFGTGYMLPSATGPMTGPRSFGHSGRGGSLAFADPEHGISFAYVMNQIVEGADDVRAASLVEAVRTSVRTSLA